MNTETAIRPKPRRRWLQFSLRTLMVLMLLISVPLGWLGIKVREARRQRGAVQAVAELGGHVMYSWESIEKHRGREPFGIWCLARRLLGDDFLASVDGVTLAGCPIEDDDVKCLFGFRCLEYLRLSNTKISDAGMAYVARLDGLQRLDVSNTKIGDASVACLSSMPRLRRLLVYGTDMTPRGFAQLKSSLPDCEVVFDSRRSQEQQSWQGSSSREVEAE